MGADDKKGAQELYDAVGGKDAGWDYAAFESKIYSDPAYRKNIYDKFGGEKAFGGFEEYDTYFGGKKKDEQSLRPAEYSLPPATNTAVDSGKSSPPPVSTTQTDLPEADLSKLPEQKPFKTGSDFKDANGLTDVKAYNDYLKNESPEEYKARTESVKAELPEARAYIDKINQGDFSNVDADRLSKIYQQHDVKPSDAAMSKLKDYADNKAGTIGQQVTRMQDLAAALESANASASKDDKPEVLQEKVTLTAGLLQQYNQLHQQLKKDVATVQGLDNFYSDVNKWYDKNKTLGENLGAAGSAMLRAVALGDAQVMKQLDAATQILATATGTKKGGLFEKLGDKFTSIAQENQAANRDSENVLTKVGEGVGGLLPMMSQIFLTPELKLGAATLPKFVTYMGYSGALNKVNESIDVIEKQSKTDFENLPFAEQVKAEAKAAAKGGAQGLAEGLILHGLTMGAARYGANAPSRAILNGTAFAGYEEVKGAIQGHNMNDKDLIASFILGAGLSLQGEMAGNPATRMREKLEATKKGVDKAAEKMADMQQQVMADTYISTKPDLVQEVEKAQGLPAEQQAEAMKVVRERAMAEMPEEFKTQYTETTGKGTKDQNDLLKIAKDKAAKDLADFDAATPTSLKDIIKGKAPVSDVLQLRRLFNTYNLGKDFQRTKDFVRDGFTVSATPAELLEIKKIMDENWTDFIRAKSYGEAIGADKEAWNQKMKQMFGPNVQLLDVLTQMNSRQRGLLLARLVHTQDGELLKPNGEAGLTEGVTTGEKAPIPTEGGGEFRVPLGQKIAHFVMAKSLKDIYGFNYNKDGTNPGRSFWQMSRETNREVLTNEDLGPVAEKAEDLRIEADQEVDADAKQAKRLAAQAMEQIVAINKEAANIAVDPEKYIASIRDDQGLTTSQKELFFKMIDDVLQNKGALGAQAAALAQYIESMNKDLNSIPASLSDVQKQAMAGLLQDQIDGATEDLKKLYDSYVPAKERADQMAAEEAKAAEETAKAKEEKKAEAEKEKKGPVEKPGVLGTEAEVRLSDQSSRPAKFAAVEADQLLTSHDPFSFNENKDFPTKNDRDYSLPQNQANVINTAANYDTRGISDNEGVAEGSPVVAYNEQLGKYVVLSGNERTMGYNIAAKNETGSLKPDKKGVTEYKAKLVERAGRYGLDPEAIGKMNAPVFVRVVDEPAEYSTKELSLYNPRAVGKAKSAKEYIASMKDKISDAQRERLAAVIDDVDAENLSDIWNSPGTAKKIYDYLLTSKIIDIKEVPELFTTKGDGGATVFSATGKEIFKMMLSSGIIDADVLQYKDVTGVAGLYNTITSGLLTPLYRAKKNNPALIKTINNALLLEAKARLADLPSVGIYLNQMGMFEDAELAAMTPTELAEAAEMNIILNNVPVKKLKDAINGLNDMASYNEDQRANPGVFGVQEKDEAAAFNKEMDALATEAAEILEELQKQKKIGNEQKTADTKLLRKPEKPAATPAKGGKNKSPGKDGETDSDAKKGPTPPEVKAADEAINKLKNLFPPAQEVKKSKFKDIEGMDDLLDDFAGAKEEQEPYNPESITPEKIVKGQKMVKRFMENGIYDLKDMMAYIHERQGPSVARDLFEPMRFIYLGMRGMMKPSERLKMTLGAELEDLTYDKIQDYVSSTTADLEPDSTGGKIEKPLGAEKVPDESGAVGGADEEGRGNVDGTGLSSESNSSVTTGSPSVIGALGNTELFRQEQLQGIDADIPGSEDGKGSDVADESGYEAERGGENEDESAFDDGIGAELPEKLKQQKAAEGTVWERGLSNIEQALPLLLPHQQTNVEKAEKRFIDEKAKGFGIFDGTGTGKGLTGLGIAKRFLQQGKKNILIVAPSDKKVADWVEEAAYLNINASALKSTQDGADGGVRVTTYANMRQNDAIVRPWDLVLYDEAHNLNSNESGKETQAETKHREITGAPEVVKKKVQDEFDYQRQMAEFKRTGNKAGMEKLEEAYKARLDEESQKTKTVFLTATPFAWHKNLNYADGYLFDMGQDEGGSKAYNQASSKEQFFVTNFGYRMRYNKLTVPESGVDMGLMERNFHEQLKRSGSVIASRPPVNKDYSRDFLLLGNSQTGKLGAEMDRGLNILYTAKEYQNLSEAVRKKWNYLYTQRILEAIKAKEVVPIIREALKNGEKIVVFHKYNEGLPSHPFDFSDPTLYFGMEERKQRKALQEWDNFQLAHPDLVNMDLRGLKHPITTLTEAFPDRAILFNGNIPKKKRRNNVDEFNDPESGKDIIVVNLAAGEAGLNLHDIMGNKPRTTFQLGLPTRPTSAIQTEGRTVRYGMQSNAKLIYPVLHFNYEKRAFGDINNRSRTVENLAMGETARNLETAYKDGYINPLDSYNDITGTGGKEADSQVDSMDEFDKAMTYYFARQKKTAATKSQEGVDFFATPEPLGYKMVQWLNHNPNDALLEPSAGRGSIGRFFPGDTKNKFIEPSRELNADLSVVVSGGDVISDTFENHHAVNKYQGIVTNPPFGVAGKTAIAHLQKMADEHLTVGGRIVGLFPIGSFNDKLDKWLNAKDAKGRLIRPDIQISKRILLPAVTFERAGTSVRTQIIVFDKVHDLENNNVEYSEVDLTGKDDIKDFFESIRDMDMPARDKPVQNVDEYKATGGKELAELDRFDHTKTGAPIHVVKLTDFVGSGKFAEYKQMAKNLGDDWGYWSAYKGNGAIPGFIFKDQQNAVKLRDQILADQKKVLGEPVDPYKEQSTATPTITPELKKFDTDQRIKAAYGDKSFPAAVQETRLKDIDLHDGSVLKQYPEFMKRFEENNSLPITGLTLKHHEDVAHIFEPARSPLIEKLAVMFYMPDGKVVDIELHTLGSPAMVGINSAPADQVAAIHQKAKALGAKGFVFVHNHPSGNPTPSIQDKKYTRHLQRGIDEVNEGSDYKVEMMGHVVVDSDKYTVIDGEGYVNDYEYAGGRNFHLDTYPQLKVGDLEPQSRMLDFAKQITDGGYKRAIVYLNPRLTLLGYDVVPNDLTGTALYDKIKEGKKVRGAASYILIDDTTAFGQNELTVPSGLMDVISVDAKFKKATTFDPQQKKITVEKDGEWVYERLQEDEEPYNMTPELKNEAVKLIRKVADGIYLDTELTGEDLADAVKDRLQEEGLTQLLPVVDEMTFYQKAKAKDMPDRAGSVPSTDDAKPIATTTPEPFNLAERVVELFKKYDVPVNEGALRKDYLGVYKYFTEGVRVQSLWNVFVAAHEMTHALDNRTGLWENIKNNGSKELRKELKQAYQELYPAPKKKPSVREYIKEGLAVTVQYYLTDRDMVTNTYPNIFNDFIHPDGQFFTKEMDDFMNDMQDLVNDYHSLNPQDKIGARIKWMGTDRNKGLGAWKKLQLQMFDDLTTGVMIDEMMGGKYRKDAIMPNVIMLKNSSAITSNWLSHLFGIASRPQTYLGNGEWGDTKSGFRVMDYLKDLKEPTKLVEFNQLLVARRQFSDYERIKELEEEIVNESTGDDAIDAGNKELEKKIEEVKRLTAIVAKNDMPYDIAKGAVENLEPHYEKQLEVYDAINSDMVDLMLSSGLIKAETADDFYNRKGYASFQRYMEDEHLASVDELGVSSGTKSKIKSLFQRTGSDRQILPPVYSQILAINEVIRKANHNLVLNAWATAAKNNVEVGRLFEAVQAVEKKSGPDFVKVMTEGKERWYKTSAEFRLFADALTANQVDMFSTAMRAASRTFRVGTTAAYPFFLLVNIPVDAVTRFAFTKTGLIPGIHDIRTAKQIIHGFGDWLGLISKDTEFQQYMSKGGSQSMDFKQNSLDPDDAIKSMLGIKTAAGKVAHTYETALQVLELPSNLSEYIGRGTEYARAVQQGHPSNVAMLMAAEVSLNFGTRGKMGGKIGQEAIRWVAYMNVGFQALGQTIEQAKKNPKKVAAAQALLITLGISASALTYLLGSDDEKELLADEQPSELSRWIYIPKSVLGFNNTGFVKVRIPEQFGAMLGMAQIYMAKLFKDKPATFKDLLQAGEAGLPSALQPSKGPFGMMLSALPTAISPTVQTATNTRFYPQLMPIVPKGLQYRTPENQYTKYSSELAKWLGRATADNFKMSPVKTDFWIKNTFGRSTSLIISLAESAFTGKDVNAYIPVHQEYDRFLFTGRMYNNFWDKHDNSKQVYQSLNHDQNASIEMKADAFIEQKNYEKSAAVIRGAMDVVNGGKELTDQQKRDLFDHINKITSQQTPLLVNDIPASLQHLGEPESAAAKSETEIRKEELKDRARDRKEKVQEIREKRYGAMTPAEIFIESRPSNAEKADLVVPMIKNMSNAERRKFLTLYVQKGVLSANGMAAVLSKLREEE